MTERARSRKGIYCSPNLPMWWSGINITPDAGKLKVDFEPGKCHRLTMTILSWSTTGHVPMVLVLVYA